MRDLLAPLREKEMKFIRPPFFITLDLFANNFNDVIYCLVCFWGQFQPEWWPSKLTFGQYDHPSKESLQKNEFLIEGILTYFNYDVLSHCDSPPAIQKKSKKKEKNKDNEQNMPEEPLENRHELESGVENEKEISKKKRSKESRIQNQTISTRTKISPKKCQELRKRSVERLSYQILRRMLS